MMMDLKKVLGILLIIIGIAGLFLPVLQGIAMILLGLFFLKGSGSQKSKLRLGSKNKAD